LKKSEISDKKAKILQLEKEIRALVLKKEKCFESVNKINQRHVDFEETVGYYRKIKFKVHQKKRKLNSLKMKLNVLKEDSKRGISRICFGGKKLFSKQFRLEENRLEDHREWKKVWRMHRSSHAFFLGSKDESYGNQNCQYTKDNSIHIRVADKFDYIFGKTVSLNGIEFWYGQENIDRCKGTYVACLKSGITKKYYNGAISHLFFRNEHGWYIHTSVDVSNEEKSSKAGYGAIGVDFNVNFVSVCTIDRFGNPVEQSRINYHMYNKSTNQINASLEQLSNQVVKMAKAKELPIVIEALDFKNKKNILKNKDKKYARMLSTFPFRKYMGKMEATCKKKGVTLIQVNPAYTSVIGKAKYMDRYGMSSHTSAALVIARRGCGYDEKFIINRHTEKLKAKYINKSQKELWVRYSKIS